MSALPLARHQPNANKNSVKKKKITETGASELCRWFCVRFALILFCQRPRRCNSEHRRVRHVPARESLRSAKHERFHFGEERPPSSLAAAPIIFREVSEGGPSLSRRERDVSFLCGISFDEEGFTRFRPRLYGAGFGTAERARGSRRRKLKTRLRQASRDKWSRGLDRVFFHRLPPTLARELSPAAVHGVGLAFTRLRARALASLLFPAKNNNNNTESFFACLFVREVSERDSFVGARHLRNALLQSLAI